MARLMWFDRGTLLGGANWAWCTLVLSALVATAYAAIAFNWYFQVRLAGPDARAAQRKMLMICLLSVACGVGMFLADASWILWRAYDVVLAVVGCFGWAFVIRSRGLGLVDERLAHVQELERSTAQYREIAELLPQIVWTATADGRIDYSNRRWHRYGGEGSCWLDAVHPDERQTVGDAWARAVAECSAVTIEARLGGPDGYRAFLINATPILRGDAARWLGACADIEDQKQLAAERERQARRKAFFLNALSHDLRAPLHNLVLNAQLLKMCRPDEIEPANIDMIVENAAAAGELLGRLLDYAKYDGREPNALEPVSLTATVQQIVRRFQPIAKRKALYLNLDHASGAPAAPNDDDRLLVDRQKLERIVSNLVDNAIKYTSRGGITVDIARGADGAPCVRVSDTGIGVPADHVAFLFDEFYQVDNHERDRAKGFGMGLAICRSLARQIGGDVRLARTGDDGSCFELFLAGDHSTDGAGDGADRRGRPDGQDGVRDDLEAARLCRL